MTKHWSCDRWGRTTGPDSDDPKCDCSMCKARRADRVRLTKKAR